MPLLPHSCLLALCFICIGVAQTAAQPARSVHENPLLRPSTLPFQAPPFDQIRNADYQPALEEGMKQHLAEIEEITSQSAAPTFQNTIVAMERSGVLLDRVSRVFFAMAHANTDSTLQRVQAEEAPRLAAHNDAVYLNDSLFRRVESIYDRRSSLGLDAEQEALVERYYLDFVRAGARLPEADKTRLKALNKEESVLSTEFRKRLLAATKAGAVIVDDPARLAGLSDGAVDAAAEAARQRGLEGKWLLPLQNTTQQPAQASLRDRSLRERLFRASTGRAEHDDANDTRELITRLAQVRAEQAKLLGYSTFADYKLADQMAKTPEAAIKLLTDLVPAAKAKAQAEAAKMQALIDQQGGSFQLEPWDWQYYAEQVRRTEYALDEAQIKPYFELDRVLRDGVFYAANQLYGLTFRERKD
ncbi:MAG TPA: M3 family metallopeptidase, partial [Rhodothermales bacterium]|nr:M3 family metallopeptidase [Rhodothermales bacterium]